MKMMFSYIHFNCKECEKPLEFAIDRKFENIILSEDRIPPLLGMHVTGDTIVCKCGVLNILDFNRKENKLSVI